LRGSIQNPLSTEELIAKFKDCAGYAKNPLSASVVDRLINRILNLEQVKDIAEVTSILS
jgi:aconitate decarboxylase